MKEDILKFRKLCDVLIKQYDMTTNKISIESEITWPTIKKLLTDNIYTIGIQASVLGKIQDYLHKKVDYVDLSDIKAENHHRDTFAEKAEKAEREALADDHDSVKLAPDPIPIDETEKFQKPDKDNAKPIGDVKKSKDISGKVEFHPTELKEKIPVRSLVEIIIFLRMEATRYRNLAHDFEVAADILAKDS